MKLDEIKKVLAAGGFFKKALETQYRWSEKFETRLYTSARVRVKGYGSSALRKAREAGLVKRDMTTWPGSTWLEIWIYAETAPTQNPCPKCGKA